MPASADTGKTKHGYRAASKDDFGRCKACQAAGHDVRRPGDELPPPEDRPCDSVCDPRRPPDPGGTIACDDACGGGASAASAVAHDSAESVRLRAGPSARPAALRSMESVRPRAAPSPKMRWSAEASALSVQAPKASPRRASVSQRRSASCITVSAEMASNSKSFKSCSSARRASLNPTTAAANTVARTAATMAGPSALNEFSGRDATSMAR
mmetsp:Transcript_32367/g.111932  ORF Transcript_32367/g.111932 Transcript_32367/m.111932 type:complete len:212 (-) Transcript_32367:877-1512(-)